MPARARERDKTQQQRKKTRFWIARYRLVWSRLVCVEIEVRSRGVGGERGRTPSAESGVRGERVVSGRVQPPGCVVPRVKIHRDCTASHCLAPSGRRPPDWSRGEIKFRISWNSRQASNPMCYPYAKANGKVMGDEGGQRGEGW